MGSIGKTYRLEHILNDDTVLVRYAYDDVVHTLRESLYGVLEDRLATQLDVLLGQISPHTDTRPSRGDDEISLSMI